MRRRILARFAAAGAVAVSVIAVSAAPASAHGSGPGPSDYRSMVVAIQPPLAGVSVRVREAGNLVELTNRSDRDVVVFGYENEPYLRIGPGGVFENRRAPSLYRNATPERVVPADAGRDQPPRWRRVSGSSTVRWHDHRVHGGAGIGGSVTSAPWSVRLRAGDQDVTVVGQRTHVPGPSPWPALAAAAALAAGVIAVAIRRLPAWRAILAAGVVAATALDVVRAAGGFAARVSDTVANRAFDQFFFSALGWVVAAVAVRALLRRPRELPPSTGFAGLFLLVLGGVGDLTALWRSQLVFAYPWWLARAAVVAALGVGGGLVVCLFREVARPVSPMPVTEAAAG